MPSTETPLFEIGPEPVEDRRQTHWVRFRGRLLDHEELKMEIFGRSWSHGVVGSAFEREVLELTLREIRTAFTELALPPRPVLKYLSVLPVLLVPWMAIRVKTPSIRLELQFDHAGWTQPFTIHEYLAAFESEVAAVPGMCCDIETGVYAHPVERMCWKVVTDVADEDARLSDVVTGAFELLIPCALRAASTVLTNTAHRVAALFDFPETTRAACEQYLLYFVQFLRDLGIAAEGELREMEGRVLFAVTPLDKEHSLAQIRDALEIYLTIPFAGDVLLPSTANEDPALRQLRASVDHLRFQLELAHATMQLKDATIENLQSTLLQPQHLQPASPPVAKVEDAEPLFDGFLKIKKLDAKGLEFDLPRFVRVLKRIRWPK